MRSTKVVSISLPVEMFEAAERLAQEEHRTMSELMREALRAYRRERERWQDVFAYGEANAKNIGIKGEQDVVRRIRDLRKKKQRLRQNDQKPGTK